MATANLAVSATFTATNATQPFTPAPPSLPTFADSTATQFAPFYLTLPAAGTSVTLPVPASWTRACQVFIQNIDSTGYCVLKLNATSGPADILLAPNGGLFAASHAGAVPSGEVSPTPNTWTLRTCDSAGVLANGTATQVYVYLAGL